jgi:O-acetyl-ADP-ribose deacetylase (regulator of RNase III)
MFLAIHLSNVFENLSHIYAFLFRSGSSSLVDIHQRPSLEGVTLSIQNSLLLARRFGHSRVAVPFIGGAIFLGSIGVTQNQLAQAILQSVLESRGNLEIRIVVIGEAEAVIFNHVLTGLRRRPEFQNLPHEAVRVVRTSILNFDVHQCTAIVNAANTEVAFGGGISGVIGNATRMGAEIDRQAQELISQFNARILNP